MRTRPNANLTIYLLPLKLASLRDFAAAVAVVGCATHSPVNVSPALHSLFMLFSSSVLQHSARVART